MFLLLFSSPNRSTLITHKPLENPFISYTVKLMLFQADEYAKGMLALGLVPGEDTFCVIGCPSNEPACLFTACSAIGIGYAVSTIHDEYKIICYVCSISAPNCA